MLFNEMKAMANKGKINKGNMFCFYILLAKLF